MPVCNRRRLDAHIYSIFWIISSCRRSYTVMQVQGTYLGQSTAVAVTFNYLASTMPR